MLKHQKLTKWLIWITIFVWLFSILGVGNATDLLGSMEIGYATIKSE
jgi:hypothetical protein